MYSDQEAFQSRGCCSVPSTHQKNENSLQHSCCKLDTYDWLSDLNLIGEKRFFDIVEVRFKNNRKEFFRSPEGEVLRVGDIVAVESNPGHDIGIVSLSGEIVRLQMRKKNADPKAAYIPKVYRTARNTDIEKWIQAASLEVNTMIQARRVVDELKLQMKINDVEYQGDKTKCIFYYTAEGRVDFRELIKILAEKFSVRIEMKQIGVRQESSRLGGIGSCGRELCCSSWLTNFRSVSTTAARTQQLSMNPQKLAGQCGKLKCCLNFEYDNYKEETKKFPSTNSLLQTKSGDAFFQKMDILSGIMYYSYKDKPAVFIPIQREDVKDIQQMNRNGKMPDALDEYSDAPVEEVRFENVIGQDDLNRFDNLNKPARKKGNKNRNGSQNKNTDNSRKVQGNSNNKKRKEFSRDNNKSKGAGEQKNVNQSNSRNQQNNARSEKPTNINRPKKRFDKRSNRPNTTE